MSDTLSGSHPASWTLTRALEDRVLRQADANYCTFSDGGACTFGELDAQSSAFAGGLARLGVGPDDRVMIRSRNRLEFLVAFYGVQKRRAVLVPINTELRGLLLRHQVADSRPKLVICDEDVTVDDEAIFEGVEGWIVIGPSPSALRLRPHWTFEDLCVPDDRSAVLVPHPDDTCLILYTSGTSGPSKGVLIPQAHALLFGLQQAQALAVTQHERFFVALPMFHVNALLMALGSCLVTGASAYVLERFSASLWLQQIRDSGATVTNTIGVMAEFILRQPATAGDRAHPLKRMMAVPVLGTWAEAFRARFGIELVQVYGMTECNIVSFSEPEDDLVPGRIGKIRRDYFDVAVLDPETGCPLQPGGLGEIAVRPNIPVCFMQGYLGLPEVTLASWRGLWFHTGDAGKIDQDGYLHFVDRMGDCIRRRGENISSVEIENVLLGRSDISEVAVVGIKIDGAGGEDEIKACIVPAGRIDLTELVAWCQVRLPRYAVPRFYEVTTEFEKTGTGKIRKQALRAIGVTDSTWDRDAGDRPIQPMPA